MSVRRCRAPVICSPFPRPADASTAEAPVVGEWSAWVVGPPGAAAADVLRMCPEAAAPTKACSSSVCAASQPSRVRQRPARCLERAGDFIHDEIAVDMTWASGYLHHGAAAGVEVVDAAGRGIREEQAQERGTSVREIVVPPQPSIRQISDGVMKARAEMQRRETVESRTTVVLRRLPRAIDVKGVCCLLDDFGLAFTYDVVQVPSQHGHRSGDRGRAFVNFLCPTHAEACVRFCNRPVAACGRRSCTAAYSEFQGVAFVAKSMAMHFQKMRDPICLRGSAFEVT